MYCRNCGKPLNPDCRFCENCGAAVEDNNSSTNNAYNTYDTNNTYNTNNYRYDVKAPVQKRELAMAIVLSIITCGIYGIVWFINLTNDMNRITGNNTDTSGGTCFLLGLVTCGIYTYYWAYRMGQKNDQLCKKPDGSSSVIFLILAIFGLGIVNYIIAQNSINEAMKEQAGQ